MLISHKPKDGQPYDSSYGYLQSTTFLAHHDVTLVDQSGVGGDKSRLKSITIGVLSPSRPICKCESNNAGKQKSSINSEDSNEKEK